MKTKRTKLSSLKRKHVIVNNKQLKEINGGKTNDSICPEFPDCP